MKQRKPKAWVIMVENENKCAYCGQKPQDDAVICAPVTNDQTGVLICRTCWENLHQGKLTFRA
jgi:hypothetical protein